MRKTESLAQFLPYSQSESKDVTAAFLALPSFFPGGNTIRFLCWNSFNRQMEAAGDGFRLDFTYFNNFSWNRTLSEEEAIPL